MSNYLSIAAVTASLQAILSDAVGVVSGARVLTERPQKEEADSASPRVNVFLYHVAPHGAWRSTDTREQCPITLQYLLSFYGDEKRFEPQLLLGSAVRKLHEEPILTAERIESIEDHASFLGFPGAMTSELALQDEPVTFTPVPLTLEDLSKIWSTFLTGSYALSVAYQAGVVYLDREEITANERLRLQ